MGSNINFDTFLYLSPKKIILSVNKKQSLKSIYKNEILIDNFSNEIDFKKLDKFLNENIFKIEKNLGDFVKNISIGIFSENIFNLQISVKKNNHNNKIDDTALIYLLNEAKDQCEKSIQNNKIIHILIDSYRVDKKFFFELPSNIKCESFSLDLTFICLSLNLIKELEKTFEKYQISVSQFLCAKYIEEYSEKENIDFFSTMEKIINGYNKNEVKLVDKIPKNRGFFEKFFDFFS